MPLDLKIRQLEPERGTSQQSFLPCLSAVFIVHSYLLTGTPLHNLVITLVQQISYFPCLLNKDIDKS